MRNLLEEGAIALITKKGISTLVEVMELEYETVMRKTGGSLFRPKFEPRQELRTVWWRNVGDNSGIVHTNYRSYEWDWDQLIRNARTVYEQSKFISLK